MKYVYDEDKLVSKMFIGLCSLVIKTKLLSGKIYRYKYILLTLYEVFCLVQLFFLVFKFIKVTYKIIFFHSDIKDKNKKKNEIYPVYKQFSG